MAVVVIGSRLREENADAFYALAERMEALAASMPGFITYKAYAAEDGERVSIHEWESAEHLRARANCVPRDAVKLLRFPKTDQFFFDRMVSSDRRVIWREHPEHRQAQARGREDFYSDDTLYVCENPRTSRFKR